MLKGNKGQGLKVRKLEGKKVKLVKHEQKGFVFWLEGLNRWRFEGLMVQRFQGLDVFKV